MDDMEGEIAANAKNIKRKGFGREDMVTAMSVNWPLITFNLMDINLPSGYQVVIDATLNALDSNFLKRI